jgi:hypothetical protein
MQSRAHMAGQRDDCGHGFYVRLMVVSDNRTGCHVCACQGLSKKGLRTCSVAFVTQQHINDLPVLVDCRDHQEVGEVQGRREIRM